jgi:hypothetical protein
LHGRRRQPLKEEKGTLRAHRASPQGTNISVIKTKAIGGSIKELTAGIIAQNHNG